MYRLNAEQQAVVDRAFFRPASIRRAVQLGATTTTSPDRALAVKE